ncbi:MAG: sulfotransferase domain-containing protein, partial [Candidatus Omnitrophica bacterium]|nr:sulfotransferase domain-containing protein [Candidatus Omnitrophota bacterium]
MTKPHLKVIALQCVSYTGSTWLSLVLGSHEGALAIHNPEYTQKMLANSPDRVCMIHGAACSLWPEFAKRYKPKSNFFIELAKFTGKKILIIANPRMQITHQQLNHSSIQKKVIHLIRDSRALAASYARKNPGKDILQVLHDWLFRAIRAYPLKPDDSGMLTLRYEDIEAQSEKSLGRIAQFTGIPYTMESFRFWEFEHHIAGGNGPAVRPIKYFQGIPMADVSEQDPYIRFIEKAKNTGDYKFRDERWKKELTRKDLFFIDVFCGNENQKLGYERDVFSPEEIREYSQELSEANRQGRLSPAMAEILSSEFKQQLGRSPLGKSSGRETLAAPKALNVDVASARKILWEHIIRQPTVQTTNAPEPEKKQRFRNHSEIVGLREFPFPFESALAITSDTDRTNRTRYRAYMKQLVQNGGLDFGDSAWLHSNNGDFAGLGFFSPHFTLYNQEFPKKYQEWGFLPHEMLDEYHKGNLDHWHSFLTRGPRVAILKEVLEENGSWIAPLPGTLAKHSPLFNINIFPVMAVSVVTSTSDQKMPDKIILESGAPVRSVEFRKETDSRMFRFLGEKGHGRIHFYTLFYDIHSTLTPPQLKDVQRVKIKITDTGLSPTSIYLHNIHSRILLDRIALLQDEWNVSMNLITKHAMWHFYASNHVAEINRINQERMIESAGKLESYFGSFNDGDLLFSTLADEDDSFCRIFPEISKSFGIRFIRLAELAYSCKNTEHADVYNIVVPTRTRQDDGIYALRSTHSRLPPEYQVVLPVMEIKSIATNFHLRLGQLIRDMVQHPKRCCILATHFGNLEPEDIVKTPYFPKETIQELREKMFHFSPRRSFDKRIWFTRASVLCDYALMIQTLPEAIARPDENTVKVQSWQDPVLDMRL